MKTMFAAAAALALAAGAVSAGSPVGIQHYQVSDEFEIYVPCIDTVVTRHVDIEANYHQFETASGIVHILDNWKATLIDVDSVNGRAWFGQGFLPNPINIRSDGTATQWESNIRFAPVDGHGTAYMFKNSYKLTVNANGELVVLHEPTEPGSLAHKCLGADNK